MIHINKLYENFNSEYNTTQLGFFRPVTDFIPAVIEVSLDIFNKLVPEATKSQRAQDWLMPFFKTMNIAVTKIGQNNIVPLPPDYESYFSCRILMEDTETKGENECDFFKDGECHPFDEIAEDIFVRESEYQEFPVRLVPSNKWAAVSRHKTKGPEVTRPYIRQTSEGFIILPKGLGVVVLDYYRKPKEPVFNYRSIESDPDVYLEFIETGSTHLEWSDTLTPVFLYHLGKRYGLTIQHQLILQVRNLDKLFE